MSGLIARKRYRCNACKPFRMRIPSSKWHAGKVWCEIRPKIIFLALSGNTSGTDKRQHVDGKFDGDFSFENRLSFEKQLDKKLVHHRVGMIV